MATNAVATKPSPSAAKKAPLRQPPADTVWLRYHPWMEGLAGHIISWAIHGLVLVSLVVGGWLLVVWGITRPPHSLPVAPVTFADAGGGGNPNGSGDDRGNHAPLKEGAASDKPNPGDSVTAPNRPSLPDVIAKKVDQDFSAPDARYIKEGPESARTFAELDKDLRDKLRDGINPSAGKAGPGTGGGEGTGTGSGTGSGTGAGTGKVLNEREKRMLRWSMKFNTRDGRDYLNQLRGLGAILAVDFGRGDFKVVDLAKGEPYHLEDRDLSSIQRIWWFDDNPASIQSLMAAMQQPVRASRVAAFIPQELEEELARKEKAFRGLEPDQIYETKFEVHNVGGRYDVEVMNQTPK
jgi:hypothetical protein